MQSSCSAPDFELDGDVDSGRFSVHRYSGGRFVGRESVGMPSVHLAMRRRLSAERAAVPG
jgi:hypothetical protein